MAVKQIYLGLAIHNHQPVGNFPWVFAEAYKNAYLPMLRALKKHPLIKLSLHYSGPLLDWLIANRPEFIQDLKGLVQRGQVELMTGGYYEPVLSIIPDADKQGQILKMTAAIKDIFGFEARGLWLAERVWEPQLPKNLAEAGISWTVVDDTHFKLAGLEDKDLFGYYITEEQGQAVKIFGSSKYLRYSIPWKTVEQVIGYFKQEASEKEIRIAVMGDDGEKFGTWPETYKHCWTDGWMERFFTAIEENREWLHLEIIGEFIRKYDAVGRIYLPCASYDEMMEWALPHDRSSEFSELKHAMEEQKNERAGRYFHGGFWRNFLVKYPEINWMQKKMLYVHRKVYEAGRKEKDAGKDDLWQGQCNCPYWHGVFGGVYLADIRSANYRHLIAAENTADRIIHEGRLWHKYKAFDFDRDGREELLLENNQAFLAIKPDSGGAIFEWDLRNKNYNLLSTLSRRPEAYHRLLLESLKSKPDTVKGEVKSIHEVVRVKTEHLESHLTYDWYQRVSLLDHFIPPETNLESFRRSVYQEAGDFVNQPYQYGFEETGEEIQLLLTRNGSLWSGDKGQPVEVRKLLRFNTKSGWMVVEYTIANRSASKLEALFGSEWNLNLLGGGRNPAACYSVSGRRLEDASLESAGEITDCDNIKLANSYLGIEVPFKFQPAVRLWRFPVQTVSSSEGGMELSYQSSCIVALLPCNLNPGEKLNFNIEIKPP